MLQIPRWQTALILIVLLIGVAFAAPNLVSREASERIPDWLPKQQISLGLDLQGGSYLLLEVETEAVLEEQLNNLVDEVRVQLRGERIGYQQLGVEGQAVTFRLRDPGEAEAAEELLSDIGDDVRVSISENGAGRLSFADVALQERLDNAVQQSIEIIRRRIDETGVREPTIQRQGERRIVVQLPGIDNPERMKDILGKTARLTFRFVDEDTSPQSSSIPPGSEILPSDETTPDGEPQRRFVIRKRVMVSGENLTDAQPTFQQGQPVVSFTFDSVGGKRFADATKNNVGSAFAIVLAGKVISAPVIR
jgi:protein-export membrane protein SecD